MTDSLTRPTIDIEIRPDGTVHFHVAGAPGRECEELESIILQALKSDVLEREHTPEFYQGQGIGQRIKSLLGSR